MEKIPKQEYTAEFRELAVKRVKAGQTVGAAAKELGIVEKTLRNWVKAFGCELCIVLSVNFVFVAALQGGDLRRYAPSLPALQATAKMEFTERTIHNWGLPE